MYGGIAAVIDVVDAEWLNWADVQTDAVAALRTRLSPVRIDPLSRVGCHTDPLSLDRELTGCADQAGQLRVAPVA